jgi:outer membrane receptor protein involved in Fe transport
MLIAQDFSLSGKVIDVQNQAIPFANVLLLNPDKTISQGTVTQEDGSFLIEGLDTAGYQLKIAFVGYDDYISDAFALSNDEVFPTVQLNEVTESLEEVVLLGKKPTVVRLADRLVFTVENSIVSNGSTWDILQRTPGVINSQDNLLIRGQNATIFLNDNKVQLSPDELKNLLENLGGDTIKSIEVIANPPAQFDAEDGPVLNIITRKNIMPGYKGSVNAASTYAVFPKYSFGTSHYFKGEKLNLFANYSFNKRKEFKEVESYINFRENGIRTARWDIDFDRITRSEGHNANFILDYNVDTKNTISFSALGFLSPNMTFRNQTLTDAQGLDDTDNFNINTNSQLNTDEVNLALDLKYDLELRNGNLSTNLHYTHYDKDRSQRFGSDYTFDQDLVFRNVDFSTAAEQVIDIYTAQLDYETKLGEVTLETGAKISSIDSQSKIDFFDIDDDVQSFNSELSDNFTYDENVYAGYLSLAKEWESWSVKAGLRAEQTESIGTSIVLNTVQDLNYLEWFPSAYVQYTPNERHSFALDYGRRLARPRYQDLNPFSYFVTENNVSQGNPNLLPAFANTFNFNYTYKSSYSFDVYFKDNGENIVTLPFQDNSNFVLRTNRQNALESLSYGLDFTHGRTVVKGWYSFLYTSLFHEEETFLAIESDNAIVTNEVDGVYVSLTNYITLNKAKTFTGELSLAYFSQFLSGSYKQEANTNLTAGLRHSFWKKRATLQVTVSDLLGEANALLFSRYLNQDNGYFAVPETQNVRIGFTYNFGNFDLEDNNRSIDKTERDRLKDE